MRIKSFVVIVFLFLTCIAVTGCYPDGKGTIENTLDAALTVTYDYKSVSKYESEHGYKRKKYQFEDKNGVGFFIVSGYHPSSVGGIPDKTNVCNYVFALFENEKEKVDEALGTDFPIEWFQEGLYYELNVSQYADLEQAAVCVEKALNAILPLTVNREAYNVYYPYQLPYIALCHPDAPLGFCRFYFPCDGEDAISQAQILGQLQYNYTNHVKLGSIQEALPDEVLSKHKASKIDAVYINGERSDRYRFRYDCTLDDYVMDDLDLCMDFEGFPYNYINKGAFSNLVMAFGGTYKCEDWKAKWTIGKDTWIAGYTTHTSDDAEYVYKSMTIYKNDEKISLSEADLISNVTQSTKMKRAYSISDLVQMLGITIEVNQTEKTVYMNNGSF